MVASSFQQKIGHVCTMEGLRNTDKYHVMTFYHAYDVDSVCILTISPPNKLFSVNFSSANSISKVLQRRSKLVKYCLSVKQVGSG